VRRTFPGSILEAATACFLARGYADTSVAEVAVRAGVVKRTVYNVFEDKEMLFREVLRGSLDNAERFSTQAAAELTDPDDLPAALTALARRQVLLATNPRVVRLRRLLIGEAHRFPDLAAEYYKLAPGKVMATLATALERLSERGLLRVDDSTRAAEHFSFLVLGAVLDRALFVGENAPPDADTAVRAADDGVRAFLAAYGRPETD
jgi:TetR/AcrR family transcriptional repressor of mexJK operon